MESKCGPLKAGMFLLVGFVILTPLNSYSLQTKDEWDAALKNSDSFLGNPGRYPGDVFAWKGHYLLRAYVRMASTYGESEYLDKAVGLIDHMFYHRDDARAARGELDIRMHPYDMAPTYYLNHRETAAPGWRREFDGDRIEVVTDGMITYAIMQFVDLAYTDPRFSGYKAKAKSYVAKVRETVNMHNSSFVYNRFPEIPGAYYWPARDGSRLYSTPLPVNQNGIMASTLLLLGYIEGDVPEYRKKAEAVLDYWKMHVRLTTDGEYLWDYRIGKTGVEDFNHGHIDMIFFRTAYRYGLLKDEDMQRLANTFVQKVYQGNGDIAKKVDGSGGLDNTPHEAGYDWIELTQFDGRVLGMVEEVYNKYYPRPTWARPLLGWAELLRWSKLVIDGNPPRRPENVRLVEPSKE